MKEVKFEDITEYVPAVVTIAAMALTFSIAHGIAFGFISYTGIKVLSGRWRDLTVAILAILFALKFSFFEALQWAMNRNVLASASAVLQGAARELGFGISVLALKLEQLPLCSRS